MTNIKNFLIEDGQLKQWPTKHIHKQAVVEYLATKFEINKIYDEQEINQILKQWHTFSDWPLLRRSLIDYSFMIRKRDGTEYKRVK